jgi:hypothetical protein
MEDKKPINDKLQVKQMYELYWHDGQLSRKGLYINRKRYGYHESYFSDGLLEYKGNFIKDKRFGYYVNSKNERFYYAR